MTTGELLNHLRLKLTVMGLPLLVDAPLISFINNAYVSFVSAMGGVPDEETLTVPANATEVAIPAYVLKIKSAQRADGDFVEVLNRADTRQKNFIGVPGELKYLIVGTKAGYAKVAYAPLVDTVITIDVDRLPKATLANKTDQLPDVSATWQLDLLDSAVEQVMRMNPDPAIRNRALDFKATFLASAAMARKEKDRIKSKQVRTVRYGGL